MTNSQMFFVGSLPKMLFVIMDCGRQKTRGSIYVKIYRALKLILSTDEQEMTLKFYLTSSKSASCTSWAFWLLSC